MRPVEKKKPGEAVVYENSNDENVTETIVANYSPYGKAKMPLIGNMGCYCSYCEGNKMPGELAVEHVEPKGNNGDKTAWSNFILSCNVCNSIKGHPDIHTEEYHWPHTDNTYRDFVYKAGGVVLLNPNLEEDEANKAKKLFDLVKLGSYPGSDVSLSPRDYRWKKRMEVWEVADRLKEKLIIGRADVAEIIRMAKLLGYWSVWFTVFKGHDEVRERLITDFPGTCSSCFDAHNHYEPLKRE